MANAYSQASLDVGVLDFKDPRLGNIMLRQLIMDIWSHEDSTKRVFVSVDRHFQGRGVYQQFSKGGACVDPRFITTSEVKVRKQCTQTNRKVLYSRGGAQSFIVRMGSNSVVCCVIGRRSIQCAFGRLGLG